MGLKEGITEISAQFEATLIAIINLIIDMLTICPFLSWQHFTYLSAIVFK